MSERKLRAWQDAGLIDAATVAAIQDWEARHSRPLGLWALIGLGALAIGLGLISLVAANWDAIAGEARLGIHFSLMAGLAAFLWWRTPDAAGETDFFHDALLFVAGALGLTFFGHLGQVYQTSSPLWQPLLAWLLLFTPLLLIFGRGWPTAAMWMAGVIGTAWSHASTVSDVFDLLGRPGAGPIANPILYWGLITSPPMAVAALSAFMRERSRRTNFWRRLEQMAFFVIMVGTSVAITVRGWDGHVGHSLGIAALQSLSIGGAAVMTYFARPSRSGQATAAALGAAALLNLLAVIFAAGQVGGALLFMALWCVIAYGAIHTGWRMVFQVSVAILALRLIILSFELADDLLGSGLGLVLVGLLTLGIAWMAVRISRRYAPKEEVRR